MTAHPVCEEWLRLNPKKAPKDPQAAKFVDENPDYVLAVVDRVYFRPGWKARIIERLDGNDGFAVPVSDVPADGEGAEGAVRRTESPADGLEGRGGHRATPNGQRASEALSARLPKRAPTEAEILSFSALGVSVCMTSDTLGEVWLVPSYSEPPDPRRREITPEHALTLCRIVEAFPGATVSRFLTPPSPEPQALNHEPRTTNDR